MKKIGILALFLSVLLVIPVFAESIDISNLTLDELQALQSRIEERIEELSTDKAEEEPEVAEESTSYKTLQKGDKGEEVRALQARLIELNYLEGAADGSYGGQTSASVQAFQKAAGIKESGIATPDTQKALFAKDAPAQKVYAALDYNKVSRDPDQYEGEAYKFSGKVLQVMEDDSYEDSLGVYTVLRVSSKGNYDNVVYVTYWRPKGESRILEDDKVTVYGISGGLYTYTSTMGAAITIPLIEADSIQNASK